MGSSKPLDEAMETSPEAFTKSIIDTFPTREIANINEQWLHETYDVARNSEFYNRMNVPLGFCKTGKIVSVTTRKKLSESHKGKKFTDEHKKKISENYVGFRGKKHSAETRAKMSKSMRGKKKSHRTEEHNKKIGDARRGKEHSLEARKRMRKSHMGKVISPETRKKMSLALKNRIFTEEHKRKIGDAQKGIPQPKITCPHCSKLGGISPMKRWHFDNCKEIS
jgi:hypothetical protein